MSKQRITIVEKDTLLQIFQEVGERSESIVTLEMDGFSVLSNYLSLKLLLARFPERSFQIVSPDKRIRKIAESLGIRTFSKNDDIEFEEVYAQKNLLKHNFTFLEYFGYEVKKTFSKIRYKFEKRGARYKNKKVVKDSNVFLLISGLVLSLSLLAFIFYFAVSKTYVYITPELAVKTTSRNVVFTEKQENTILDTKNVVNVRLEEYTASMDYLFNISTFDTGSIRNAHGIVTFYNEMTTEQVFRPNTRLVTSEGLIFRTPDWVRVPPTRSLSGETVIGQVEIPLYADSYDSNGDIIGVRGNVAESTIFSLPGLKFNRDKIYAKAKDAFRDGQDPTIKVFTKDEYEKFRALLVEKLKMKALDGLKEKIATSNGNIGAKYDILPIPENIVYTDPVISYGSGIAFGAKLSEISLHGSEKVSSYVYEKGQATSYLSSVLKENLLYGTEKLHAINNDSLRISNILFRSDVRPFSLKATTELDATISYNFEDPTNNLTKKLKNLIVNTTEKEATSILLNDSNIASVSMRFSPFWMTRVSSNPDSIEFIIEK